MIRTILTGVQWGTDPVDDVDAAGNPVQGRQLNLFDEQSGAYFHIPFAGDTLQALVTELAKGLTDEQRRALAPEFQS